MPPKSSSDVETQSHRLASTRQGESEIEQLADRVEKRRAARIVVTFPVRVRFLHECRQAEDSDAQRIHRRDLVTLRDAVQAKVESSSAESIFRKIVAAIGFRNVDATLLEVYNRAIERVDEIDGNWLYYREFNFYDTKLESRWPWFRNGPLAAAMAIFGFLLFTPILFCTILHDEGVCPSDTGYAYGGWLTAVYFASTTMSTVGYGDASPNTEVRWRAFIAILYMFLAILVAITAFSAAAQQAYVMTLSPVSRWTEKVMNRLTGDPSEKQLLYQHMRRVKIIKLTEIIVQLLLLNLLGVLLARIFVGRSDLTEQNWTWMRTFYWAVQTTTTIGYGDLNMPFLMRWFQIFYLAFSTVFVGNAFGQLANLKAELKSLQKHYVWQRKQVNKRMVEEMQAYEHDDKIDQYEFVLSSLLALDKISSADITPIMDKFRILAGDKGFIQISDVPDDDVDTKMGATEAEESDEGEQLTELQFDADM